MGNLLKTMFAIATVHCKSALDIKGNHLPYIGA